MSKRDKVFQSIQDSKEKANIKYADFETEMKILRSERNEMAKALNDKEQECDSLKEKVSELSDKATQNAQAAEQNKLAYVQATQAGNKFQKEIAQISKEKNVGYILI